MAGVMLSAPARKQIFFADLEVAVQKVAQARGNRPNPLIVKGDDINASLLVKGDDFNGWVLSLNTRAAKMTGCAHVCTIMTLLSD